MVSEKQKPKAKKLKLDNIPFIQLLYHLEDANSELEKTWSESLEADAVQASHSELLTIWEAFTRNFPLWTEEQSTELKKLGFDTNIKRYPLDDEGFLAIGEPEALIDRYNQFSIASLYQMQNLLSALGAIKDPSHKQTSIPSGAVESWWEAGAFSLIRASVRSLAFTLEQQTALYEELTKPPHKRTPRPAWMQHLEASQLLINNELYEAAVPILMASIRSVLAERAGIMVSQLPNDLAAKLTKLDAFKTLGHLYQQLEKIAPRVALADTPERGYVVPIVIGSALQLQKLVSQPLPPELIKVLKP